MSGKFNNRTLLIVFIVLAGIFLVTRFTGVRKSGRTLNTEIVSIDTSNITSIQLFPANSSEEELVFKKAQSGWTVSNGELTVPADRASFRNALNELLNLNTEQLVAKSEERWPDFNVTDSLGTRIKVMEGKKTTLDMVIGRFDYKPVQNPYGNPYGRNQGTGITYIRNSGEDEVYAVQGFLAMTFNRNFQNWRDQSVTSFNASQLSKIVFEYPADTGFIAQRNDAGWMVSGMLADSASMASYLNRVSRKRNSNFRDDIQVSSAPDYQVTFEGDNMQPVQVRAYAQAYGEYIINSSINPEAWFGVEQDGLFSEIFKGAGELLPGGEE